MKRIAIITIQGRFNYGNRLQNYATQVVYASFGYSANSLVLKRHSVIRSMSKILKHAMGEETRSVESFLSKERLDAFDRFNQLISTRNITRVNKHLGEEYDYFSVGSDQVWNPGRLGVDDDWWYLSFCDREKRIALSPSIGADNLNAKQLKRVAKGVNKFNRLSIRESRGADIIYECSGRFAEVICDPTLVLSLDEWKCVADSRHTPVEEYIFTYVLGDRTDCLNIVDELSHQGEIRNVLISCNDTEGQMPVGPAEFISLVANARHVVTDSFHGALFAAMFERPLTIVKRVGVGSMFSRIDSLASMLGIEDKVYDGVNRDLSSAGNYEGVSERIASERLRFFEYLDGCIR